MNDPRSIWVTLGTAGLVLAWAAAALAPAPAQPSPRTAQVGPSLRLDPKASDATRAAFEVVGLAAADLAALRKDERQPAQWTALFAVHVQGSDAPGQAARPAMAGAYSVDSGVLRFQPRYPLVPGVRYRAVFDPSQLPGRRAAAGKPVVAEVTLPRPPQVATVIEKVYPSTATLPENQLKFYIHFSAPMSRGEAYQHIHLVEASGREIERPFLELEQEAWDRPMKRFTLFFDPGRVKRGLKPREELGPALEEGKTYTLVLDRQWNDAAGNPLRAEYRKVFRVTAPIEEQVDPKTWKLQAPAAGTVAPLTVTFPRPMDHALLQQLLWVTDPTGQSLAGTVTVSDEETRWQLTPSRPWQAGRHHLMADERLEDLAANNIARPFEIDVLRPIQRQLKAEALRLPFDVRASRSPH
jgi:hypothetical protein